MDSKLKQYLTFDRMLVPILIQVLFWIGVVGVVIAGLVVIAQGETGAGLGLLIMGPIGVRIYAELLIVIFKINESVEEISRNLTKNP